MAVGTKRVEIFQVIYAITLTLMVPLFIGNISLIAFHIRIRFHEITTYDFILGKRASDKRAKLRKDRYRINPESVDATCNKSVSELNSLDELSIQHVKS